jgi:dTDP-4-dehydrorhamnose 3,5-epimerase
VKFHETPLPGVCLLELERLEDERGWFARTFDREQFRAHDLHTEVVQCNISHNARRDTLRGMHYQAEPHGESKLVRCIRGSIFDVAVDLRPDSPSYCHWHSVELTAENGLALYIPAGLAHGFQTLAEDCEVLYEMGYRYVPEAARGVRYDDPAFAIRWPPPQKRLVVSPRDASYPDFKR